MSMNTSDPRWIFVPFAGFLILIVFGLICVALAFRYKKRELQHRERLAALERGIAASELVAASAPWTPRVYLLRGLMWLFAGLGLTVFLLGLSVSDGPPKGAALLGLIPIGVGLAYLITYRAERGAVTLR
jgi:hypothetical protein